MITGQLITVTYNKSTSSIHESLSKTGERIAVNNHINCNSATEFKKIVQENLDKIPQNNGYVLIKWSDRLFICESNKVKPDEDYVRYEITYHPLKDLFS